ncbi:MAG: aminotransferase class I/II-fold pyridoxal phosphate-dependent enzyme [Chloroflexi bacterium]|nr:aminotransferase class I/II-fold pyridoxal phosphate-dependent enzyme [Chloroflexota bacterium]
MKNKLNFISERARQIPPSGIRKYFDLACTMKDVISLGVGEPDFVTPWHIREAAIDAINRGYTMYTSNYGLIELRQELSRHLKKRYEVEYNPDNELLITVGVSEALDIAIRAILDPGDEIIVHDPGYVAYAPCIIMAGAIPVAVPTTVENNYRLLASEVEKRITKKTKAILLGFPNNPTGAVMKKNDLIEIAALAKKYNLLVISDEIYDRLVYNGGHTCFSSLPGMKEQTILLGGFSKAYAMTGWRIGYAAATSEIIEAMMKIHQYIMMCAPIIGQKAALEALKYGENDVLEMVADYNRRRRIIVKGLNDIGLTCFEPHGAFYAFPSIKTTSLSSEDFAEKLLQEEQVVVVPGSVFGECGKGHIRCCYAVSLNSIQEALRRIDRFVKKHRTD